MGSTNTVAGVGSGSGPGGGLPPGGPRLTLLLYWVLGSRGEWLLEGERTLKESSHR